MPGLNAEHLPSNPYEVTAGNTPQKQGAMRTSRKAKRAVGSIVWAGGTLLLTLLIAIDALTPAGISGGFVYIALLLGPLVALLATLTTPFTSRTKWILALTTAVLTPLQVVIIGIARLLATGFEGIH